MWLEEDETLKNGQGRECCLKKKMGSKPRNEAIGTRKDWQTSSPQGLQEERNPVDTGVLVYGDPCQTPRV